MDGLLLIQRICGDKERAMVHRGPGEPANLELHRDALENAKELIRQKLVDCGERNWEESKPIADSENRYLTDHSMHEFGKWYLATKEGIAEDTKEHYEFPFGDFHKIFRSSVIAIKQRAAQYKHEEIEQAADELLAMIDDQVCEA